MKNIGLTDNEAVNDLLNIDNYTNGLKDFIVNCDTPMTISIQGTWGTGKTSIMSIVRKELESASNSHCIWFNAWQFSQFNMGEGLVNSLLEYLVDELKPDGHSNIVKFVNGLKLVGTVGSKVALSTLGRFVGVSDLDSDKIITDACNLDNRITLKAIDGFKKEFTECVEKALKDKSKERLVVFIDDLDRLEPRKAVELLEVLKLFLDCKDCVFVLAIDYDVVVHGVAQKYGYSSDFNEHTYEIGKMFFDKIIQLPFKVPVAHYDITNYIKESLKKINIQDQSIKVYEQLIRNSIGTNPRTMKRIFNAFLLVKLIVKNDMELDETCHQLLFAVLCLQHCNEKLYNYIVENRENFNEKSIAELLSVEQKVFDKIPTSEKIDVEELMDVQDLLGNIKELLSQNGRISKENYEKFLQVLNLSIVTSTSKKVNAVGSTVVMNSSELEFKGLDPDIINEIINKIKKIDLNINVEMKNLNSGTGKIIATINGKQFVEIFPRAEGYRVELAINCKGSIKDFMPDECRAFMESNDTWFIRDKKILHTIKNHELEIEDVINMIKFAKSTWNV